MGSGDETSLLAQFLHTASDQKPEPGKAWERGYVRQRRSLDPASASNLNKTVVENLATISPELELANGSLCKACFTKLKKAATYLAT